MKRVFFIIPTLDGGGAERVMIQLLKHLDRSRFQPTLILFERRGPLLAQVPSGVEVISLGKERFATGLRTFSTVEALKNRIEGERPAAALSFMWYANSITLLAKKLGGAELSVIASERTNFSSPYEKRGMEMLRRLCVRFLYPGADRVIAVSEGIRRELAAFSKMNPKRIAVIPNPVDIEEIRGLAEEEPDHPWFQEGMPPAVAVGRLEPLKGFSFLLKALAELSKNRSFGLRLAILGEGPSGAALQIESRRLGIDDRVAFLGHRKNPYKYLARASLFVLPSLCEGFPNALLEALALGVPCVATRCPTGPEEILVPGESGLLVTPADVFALAEAMAAVLDDGELAARLRLGASRRAEDFRVDKIVRQYESILEKTCAASAES